MSEAETLELLSTFSETGGAYMTMYVSFTFAYLTVAYFVGKSLSRFQCFAVTVLYVISTVLSGSAAIGWADAWTRLKRTQPTIIDDVWLMANFYWVETLTTLLTLLGVVSLYFMYDVRQKA